MCATDYAVYPTFLDEPAWRPQRKHFAFSIAGIATADADEQLGPIAMRSLQGQFEELMDELEVSDLTEEIKHGLALKYVEAGANGDRVMGFAEHESSVVPHRLSPGRQNFH